MRKSIFFIIMSLLMVLAFIGTSNAAIGICGDGVIDPGDECNDGDTNDYHECCNHQRGDFPHISAIFYCKEKVKLL